MFYVIISSDDEPTYVSDDNGHVKSFETEAEAIAEAKDYSGVTLITKAIVRVTDRTTHKVEKIK